MSKARELAELRDSSGNVDATSYTGDGSALTGIAGGVVSVNTQTGAVVLDADDIADASTTNKFATATQLSKLDAIEALADVTDSANVTAAGALMDSEITNLNQVKTFDSSDFEPADSTILKDADIGVSVMAYDATMLVDADIGVNVEAYDATILKDADIGVNVLAYDANVVSDATYVATANDFTTVLKNKLDGIEASANVTDATNVAAAGALMDSEISNLADVKTFDPADYATAAQGTTADAALPKAGGALTGAVTTTSTFDGRDVATDGTKLDGIEALADVTDAANVEPLVDAHLNQTNPTSGYVLGWSGSDYEWVDKGSVVMFAAKADVDLAKGEVVYLTGISGNTPTVDKAQANASGTMPAFGITGASVTATNTVDIITFGSSKGHDVGDFGATGITFALGDTVYVSAAEAGKLTNVAPAGESNLIQNIGKIERATPTTNITIKVGGAGRTNATPALNDGNIFIGNAQNQSSTVSLATAITTAGALMDSEVTNLAQVKAFDSSDYQAAGSYEPADATILKDADIGVNVLAYDANVVSDISYVRTDLNFTYADHSKLDGIETGATADMTGAEIQAAYEVQGNAWNTTLNTKLGTIETGATADMTGAEIQAAYEIQSNAWNNTLNTKLSGIETGATADMTGAEIQAAYEVQLNAWNNTLNTKLGTIETNADVTDTTNVTAAGALMDSEVTNLAQVKAFNSADYATAAQGATADSALQSVAFGDLTTTPTTIAGYGLTDASTTTEMNAAISTAVGNLIDSAPTALDTLNELAASLGDDADFAGTMTTNLASKLPLAGGALTGAVTTTSTIAGRDVATDGTKLDTIATNADVTPAWVPSSDPGYLTSGSTPSVAFSDLTSTPTTLSGYGITDGADATKLPLSGGTMTGTLSHSGAFYLDSENAITLDANLQGTLGGIRLSDGGTEFGSIYRNNGHLNFRSPGATVDILLGDDSTTALTLDMGNTGRATFSENIVVAGTVDGRDVATDGTKLDTIETNATADQTAAEIRALVASASDSQVFTDADRTKLDGIAASANNYSHPTHPGDNINIDTGALTGAAVISDIDFNITTDSNGHVTDANATVAQRTLTLADLGYTGATNANNTVTNATHTGEVTGSGALTIANDVVDAANLKVNGYGSTTQFLRSDGDGTFTWAVPINTTYTASEILTLIKTVDGSGSGLDADTLDGISSSGFLRSDTADTFGADLTIDNGTSTLVNVKCDDGGNAIVRAGGDNQGTGAFEVSQDNGSHGGGMSYNGDGTPAFVSGETSDRVTFYRISTGTRSEVFSYAYSGDQVDFNGAVTSAGDITAYYSDERLKDFSGKIDNALDIVSQLNGYYYTGNEKAGELGYDTESQQVGVSAQEVESVLPHVVKDAPINRTAGTDYKTVQYDRLVPVLIEATKELKAENDELKARLANIEKMLLGDGK